MRPIHRTWDANSLFVRALSLFCGSLDMMRMCLWVKTTQKFGILTIRESCLIGVAISESITTKIASQFRLLMEHPLLTGVIRLGICGA